MLSAMAWVVGANEGEKGNPTAATNNNRPPQLKRIDTTSSGTASSTGAVSGQQSPRAGCDLPSPSHSKKESTGSDNVFDIGTLPPSPLPVMEPSTERQPRSIVSLKRQDLEMMRLRTTAEMQAQNEAISNAEADRKAREAEGLRRKQTMTLELSKKAEEDRQQREHEFEQVEAQRRQVTQAGWEAQQPSSVMLKTFYTGDMSVENAKKVVEKGKVGAAAAAFRELEQPILKLKERDAEVRRKAAEDLEARRKAKAETDAKARREKAEAEARRQAEIEMERQRLAQEAAQHEKEQADREFAARMAEEAKLNEAEKAVLRARQAEERARFAAEAPDAVVRRLKDGVEVSKHSRNGHTVRRVLMSEDGLQTLSWCKPDHKHLTPEKTFNLQACRAVRGGLDLDPTEVGDLTGTAVLRQRAAADLARSFALVFDDRTIDFTCDSAKDCRLMVTGLKGLLFPQLRHL